MTMAANTGERDIIVTCCDDRFFNLLEELLQSIRAVYDERPFDIGCLDLGLTTAQIGILENQNVKVVQPKTGLRLPAELAQPSNMHIVARPYLPENFPGYQIYVWLDADVWIQSTQAISHLIATARRDGAAFVPENDPTYKSNFGLLLWKGKHYLQGYGAWRTVVLLLKKQINNGVFAMRVDAPHWAEWRKAFQSAVDRSRVGAPHDQFSLNAVAYLSGLESTFLPPIYNWICDLSCPRWDDDQGYFCSPGKEPTRIEVVHLAGPIKATEFDIRTTRGRVLRGRLRFGAELEVAAPKVERRGSVDTGTR